MVHKLFKLIYFNQPHECKTYDITSYSRVYSHAIPAGNYLFKVDNKSTRTRCEICSKLTIKTPERRLVFFWCLYF